MRVVLALLSLSALGQGVALRDPAIDEYIAAILELLKTQMPTGIPDLGIPPLDPFEVPHFDIDPIEVSDPVPININITIDDFVIKNLATFETQLAHLDLEGLGLELNLTLADLRGDATYSLDGTALGIFPIYGNGPMYLELFGVTLHAKAAVLINAEGFVEITEMDIAADFDDIAIHLDDLVGGGNFGETINNPLLSELARKHGAGGGRHTDAVEELKNAFELAERSSPGITNRLVEQVLSRLQPGLSEARLALALENLGR